MYLTTRNLELITTIKRTTNSLRLLSLPRNLTNGLKKLQMLLRKIKKQINLEFMTMILTVIMVITNIHTLEVILVGMIEIAPTTKLMDIIEISIEMLTKKMDTIETHIAKVGRGDIYGLCITR